MANFTYRGLRTPKGETFVWREDANGKIELPFRLDLSNHSPSGLNWGYGGSGPAQLALALLADFFGDTQAGQSMALALYQSFKRAPGSVCGRNKDRWEITGEELRTFLGIMIVDDLEHMSSKIRSLRDKLAFKLESEILDKLESEGADSVQYQAVIERCMAQSNAEFSNLLQRVFGMSENFSKGILGHAIGENAVVK